MSHSTYQSPLASRYASQYMLHLFSDDSRYQTWRRLWAALARAQQQLGLPVTEQQVAELEAHIADIDYDMAAAREYVEYVEQAIGCHIGYVSVGAERESLIVR